MSTRGLRLPGLARELRVRLMNRHEFALLAGVKSTTLYRACAGEVISLPTARAIAAALSTIPIPEGVSNLTSSDADMEAAS